MNPDPNADVFKVAFDPVVGEAPDMPRFDDIVTHAQSRQERSGSRWPLGIVTVGISLLVVAAVGSVVWMTRGHDGDTAIPADHITTTTVGTAEATTTVGTAEATTTLASTPTYTLADGRVYAQTDCPAAANLLKGGYDAADALPERSQTEQARVEAWAEQIRQRYIDSNTDVIDVRAIPRSGEVWYRLDTGGYAVEMADDYQLEIILGPSAECPTAPVSIEGIPVLYNRADKTVIDTTSTDTLQLDIIDTYPQVVGIDSLILKNIANEPIDVSGWTIASRGFYKGFTVPDDTLIEPGESIAIYQDADTRGARCREDTARVFFHCNALGQDTVTGDLLFPIPIITIHDATGTLVLESSG